jgi:hypothetical protein
MQPCHVDIRPRSGLRIGTKEPARAVKSMAPPLRDLVVVNVEMLGKLAQRLLAIAASTTFALKAGLWLRRGRLVKMFLLFRHLCRARAEIPEPPLTDVTETPPMTTWTLYPFSKLRIVR